MVAHRHGTGSSAVTTLISSKASHQYLILSEGQDLAVSLNMMASRPPGRRDASDGCLTPELTYA